METDCSRVEEPELEDKRNKIKWLIVKYDEIDLQTFPFFTLDHIASFCLRYFGTKQDCHKCQACCSGSDDLSRQDKCMKDGMGLSCSCSGFCKVDARCERIHSALKNFLSKPTRGTEARHRSFKQQRSTHDGMTKNIATVKPSDRTNQSPASITTLSTQLAITRRSRSDFFSSITRPFLNASQTAKRNRANFAGVQTRLTTTVQHTKIEVNTTEGQLVHGGLQKASPRIIIKSFAHESSLTSTERDHVISTRPFTGAAHQGVASKNVCLCFLISLFRPSMAFF